MILCWIISTTAYTQADRPRHQLARANATPELIDSRRQVGDIFFFDFSGVCAVHFRQCAYVEVVNFLIYVKANILSQTNLAYRIIEYVVDLCYDFIYTFLTIFDYQANRDALRHARANATPHEIDSRHQMRNFVSILLVSYTSYHFYLCTS